MIFDEPHRMRGTRLIRPIEPIQSFCSSASCFKGLFACWLVFPVHGPVYIRETNGSSEECFPVLVLDQRHLSLGSLHNVFPCSAAVAWKLVASAMLRSLETVSMKVSS